MRLSVLVLSVVTVLLVGVRSEAAEPTDTEKARALFKKATAAYALGRFAEAAEAYENAFGLEPDPALLYNAAQAHRIAGNKARALLLYQNYLRVYGAVAGNREEVQRRIVDLKKSIERDEQVATAPPVSTQQPSPKLISPPPKPAISATPIEPTPTPDETTTAAAATKTPEPTPKAPEPTPKATEPTPTPAQANVVTAPAPERPRRPRWVWGVVGGAVGVVVIGLAVGLGVGLGSSTKNPTGSLGSVDVVF